jgi:glycosyltransferase involved in cell wall biosynthesis
MVNSNTSVKILFLHSSSDLYGASKIFLQTVLICKDNGYEPLVCLGEKGPLSDKLEQDGVKVHYIRLGVLRRKYVNPVGLINRFYFISRSTYMIARLLKKEKIPLVYNNSSSIFSAVFAAKLAGTRHIWHIHELFDKPAVLVKFVGKIMEQLSHKNIVVSSAAFTHWSRVSPRLQEKKKLLMIHNGIDSTKLHDLSGFDKNFVLKQWGIHVPDDTVIIGMIARVHFWKGQTYFLRIAAEIVKLHRKVIFLMAGDALPDYEYLYDEINSLKKELQLEPYVFDLGYQADNTHFFQAIDLLVLPSVLPDPLPTVVLEAMCASKPVIATAHGGSLDMVVHNETGYLVPWDNAAQAFTIMEPLVLSAEKRKEMGGKGYQRSYDFFSPQTYSRQILAAISSVLSE